MAQLIAAGDSVVATIRNPQHMADLVKLGAETLVLDLDKSTGPDFQKVFKGADAIVFAAGSAAGEPNSNLDRTGTIKTVRAAVTAEVPRYVTISSIGASTGMRLTGALANEEMRDYYKQKRAANKALRASPLQWTIVEPGELTDDAPTGKVTLTEAALEHGTIPRADVAAVVVAVVHAPATIGKALQLVSGTTPVAEAVEAIG
jgi:uncharacterized protein YbjT (DUF2867 family)